MKDEADCPDRNQELASVNVLDSLGVDSWAATSESLSLPAIHFPRLGDRSLFVMLRED